MQKRGDGILKGRFFSLTACVLLILNTLLIGINLQVPTSSAAAVNHDIGNLDINALSDYGRFLAPISWGTGAVWNYQATREGSGASFIGLVLDQDSYDHTAGLEQVADGFGTYPYVVANDFTYVTSITIFTIDGGETQKSVASFQNTASSTGDANDILIDQVCWTRNNKDWAILQWTLNNLKGVPITGVSFGLEMSLSQAGNSYGVGGDSGDDIDGFDGVNDVYWAQDDNGAGTCIGFGSAIVTDPITHYFSMDYHPATYDDYRVLWQNDTWMYNRLHAANSVEGNSVAGNRTSVVGWDGFNIPAGESKTLTLVIAANNTFNNMLTAIQDAQFYYNYVATGFVMTEIRDSGSPTPRIEVFNNGRLPTNPIGLLSFTANVGALTGTWSQNPIPTYGYSYFTPNENLDSEGDTITFFENAVQLDQVSYGQAGIAPDPLDGESIGKHYDTATYSYTNEWVRNASTGPTWDAENDVGSIVTTPLVVINRVMFNPLDPVEGYVEIMFRGGGMRDISNYKIVCDDAFVVPSGTSLSYTNRFYVFTYSNFPTFFTNMNAIGDNVYLYDNNDNLLDMVGWSSAHTQGYFMSRIPDGNGTFQGYDDTTSSAAGWVFDQLPSMMITEFYAAASSASVEIYNPRGGDKAFASGWSLRADSGVMAGTWAPIPTRITSGGYSTFSWGGGASPYDEGDTISLNFDPGSGDILMDEVSFGTFGVAPDPLSGESTARYYNSSSYQYHDEWNRDPTDTFGAQNDVPGLNLSSYLVLTEVMFNPTINPDGKYVVLTNREPLWIWNVMGYTLVSDDYYTIPYDIGLGYGDRLIIRYGDDSPASDNFFATIDGTGDNVYLYNDTGVLCDMVGWTTAHTTGMSVRRVPSVNGTNDGYDDTSSVAAGWVFNSPLEVLITEISDSESSPSQIELYNPWYPTIDFSSGFIFTRDLGPITPNWVDSTANSGEYAYFNVDVSTPLGNEGDTISLYQGGVLIEDIGYGLKGLAPDPLPSESVQRIWLGFAYDDVWSRNTTTGPNFGAQNDVPRANFTSIPLLNEIMFNPIVPADYYVELYLRYGGLDISGYKIVGDTEYIIPMGTVLTPDYRFYYLLDSMDPAFFSALNPSGDNVYLYDNNGSLLDMAGWSSSHTQGKTMCRIPKGNGTRDGFDDVSSRAAGWFFDCNASIQLIQVDTPDDVMYGSFGGEIFFNLTITNKQSANDTILLFNSTLHGYQVVIYDETGKSVITELFMDPDSTVGIMVKVTLPSTFPFYEWDNITITIQSENVTLFWDSILLQAVVYPFIRPQKYAFPQQIYYEGTGHDEISTITLNITGMGSVVTFIQPQDVIFCVDISGSMSQEGIDLAKEGLTGYVDEMDQPDQGAVVVFGYSTGNPVRLLHPLTDNYTQLLEDIQSIPGPQGGTDIATALMLAIDELLLNGNGSHIQVIILLTDGENNAGPAPVLNMAHQASDNNIMIFTIGLEPAPGYPFDEATLMEVANITGGQYFYAESADILPEIYSIIAAYIGDIAGRDPDVTDAVPMIRDVLPRWITLVEGSFSIPPDVDYFEKGNRILEWNISTLGIGESWEVTFQVKSTGSGWVYANDVNASRVYYVDYYDNEIFTLFPEVMLYILPPMPRPPELFIELDANGNDIKLYWEPKTPGTNHYLIYNAQSPTDFDFSSPWINTSLNIDPKDPGGVAVGNRLSWNHTGAAEIGHLNYSQQWYYCIRSVNDQGEISYTSRTVGKWTKEFPAGNTTFSLPLEPITVQNTEFYCQDMNTRFIKWMNPVTHRWVQHDRGEIGDNINVEVGKGYEIDFTSPTKYTFLGMPGAMIRYDTGMFTGFDYNTDAKSLMATVDSLTGDVTLTWDQPSSMNSDDYYHVYHSTTRDGFYGTLGIDYFLIDNVTFAGPRLTVHAGVAQPGTQHYYMVIPLNEMNVTGGSTYSIGVWTAGYLAGYDTLGIPLILDIYPTADSLCDDAVFELNSTVGINYFIESEQRWGWHSTRMYAGAYDPIMAMAEGYQISTTGKTKFTFIGH